MARSGTINFVGEVESVGEISTLKIYDKYCPGLLGVDEYSHLFVIYWMHQRDNEDHRGTLRVTPPRHKGAPLTGVFAPVHRVVAVLARSRP